MLQKGFYFYSAWLRLKNWFLFIGQVKNIKVESEKKATAMKSLKAKIETLSFSEANAPVYLISKVNFLC
jgi:hypothetical protein